MVCLLKLAAWPAMAGEGRLNAPPATRQTAIPAIARPRTTVLLLILRANPPRRGNLIMQQKIAHEGGRRRGPGAGSYWRSAALAHQSPADGMETHQAKPVHVFVHGQGL